MGFRKDPLGYLAASALVQAGIYTAKAVRNLTAAEAIEAAAGLGLIASEVAPATAAAAATAAGYTAYRGGKYIYQSSKDEINWLKKTFGKKRKKTARPSQLPAPRGMSGRGPKRPRDDYNDFVRTQDRNLRRRMGKGSRTPGSYYKVKSSKKKFRKARKPIKDKGRFAARNYDDYGTIERDHSLWLGFQHHGSLDRLYDIIGESVAKSILARLKIYPRSYDEPLSTPDYDTCDLTFTRINGLTGTDDTVGAAVTIHGSSFKTMGNVIGNQLQYYADSSPSATHSARYLSQIDVYNAADDSKAKMQIKDVGESIVSVKVRQKIRFQNITKNIDGNVNLDQAGLNPLRGRKYVFANYRPKLIGEIQKLSTDYDSFQVATPVNGAPGIGVMPASGSLPADDPVGHPPIAKQLFTNCKASAAISMPAGCMKNEYTSFTMTHKMKTLIERIYFTIYDKGAFGGCTWFGLEKSNRQAKPSGATNDDRIAVGFNREVHMYGKCKFAVQKSMLKHYDATDCQLIPAE